MLVSDLYCTSCRNAKDHKPQDNEICWSCVAMGGAGNYKESKTNADRIRSMTDEELADFLYATWKEQDAFSKDVCKRCPNTSCQPKCWLDWLRQEAEEGEDAQSRRI